jgi:hypothetical protein
MASQQPETPFRKIMAVRSRLRLYVEYGDQALDGQTSQEFAADVQECVEFLMEFRNIINSMVSFDDAPSRAVIPYLSDDAVKDAMNLVAD